MSFPTPEQFLRFSEIPDGNPMARHHDHPGADHSNVDTDRKDDACQGLENCGGDDRETNFGTEHQ